MRAKINPDSGKVEWVGMGSGENWETLPDDLPKQDDPATSLHYDEDEGFYYE